MLTLLREGRKEKRGKEREKKKVIKYSEFLHLSSTRFCNIGISLSVTPVNAIRKKELLHLYGTCLGKLTVTIIS